MSCHSRLGNSVAKQAMTIKQTCGMELDENVLRYTTENYPTKEMSATT